MPYLLVLLAMVLGSHSAWAQLTWSGCSNISGSDLTKEDIVTSSMDNNMSTYTKMDFSTDDNGEVEIYIVQKAGDIKLYSEASNSVSNIGSINVDTGVEDGLVGVALDPGFKTNRWMYVYYSKGQNFVVSRLTFNYASKQIDMGSEVVLLEIPSARSRWHTSGAMEFDAYGDLWISVGDNESAEKGPGNTSDLRGGILRIHPEDDGTYSIPEGNLWEKGVEHFTTTGDAATAAQYEDANIVRREIYIQGTRNAYTMNVDPVRQWVTWGDCGPDHGGVTEEHNLFTEPVFAGWPYWTGSNNVTPDVPAQYDEAGETYWPSKDMAKPAAKAGNGGASYMLPAQPAIHPYNRSCAMAGPIYRYDGDLQSDRKLPPHFHGRWFISDWNNGRVESQAVSEDGKSLQGNAVEIATVSKPINFKIGPDGALYIITMTCPGYEGGDNCSKVERISYSGTCRPDEPKREVVSVYQHQKAFNKIFTPEGIVLNAASSFQIDLIDVSGKVLVSHRGTGSKVFQASDLIHGQQPGIYFVRATVDGASFSKKLARIK